MTVSSATAAFREVSVDGGALARNIARAASSLPADAPRVIDLGADAWGHGAALVAPVAAAAGCTHALVGRLIEALALRDADAPLDIICADPLVEPDDSELRAAGILGAHRDAAAARAALNRGEPVVAVVVDTGRGAPGVSDGELTVLRDVAAHSDRRLIVLSPHSVLGCRVFGLSDDDGEAAVGMEPVMTLWGPVVGLKSVDADEGVSYGYRYRTAAATTLALVSLGYADGLDRAAGNLLDTRTAGGLTVSIAGRVAMDAFVIDVGGSGCRVGDPVVVWGDGRRGEPSVAEAAARLGTHSAELTTRLTARPRRRLIGDGS